MDTPSPKVFISYSHDSDEHKARVLAFARALRANGIDVEIDQFHTDEIVDWPRWCNDQISRDHSDFVLCVCTAEYRRRIEGKVPPTKGKGVYWEGSLLDDDLYDEKGNSRLIPVLFDDEPDSAIPRFLRGWTFCRLRDFAVADPGYETLIRILTGQASVEKNALGPVPVLPPKTPPPTQPPVAGSTEIAPTRLHHGADHLVGREEKLADLDKAWTDPATHLLTIVAFGGVGKTALIATWEANLAKRDYDGARFFDWSFYSQGTREQGAASADAFIAKALTFFGDKAMADSPTSPWDKGARLAQLVAERPTLLVLDGLEPLQYPPGPLGGQLKDPAIEALLKGLAQHNPGLCVVTTRERLTDLAPFNDTTAPEWTLENLSDQAGAALLHQAGANRAGAVDINRDDPELRAASSEVNGHALTLRLLGTYLAKAHQGDIRKRDRVKFTKADARTQGGHAFKTMAAYERWFSDGSEDGARALAVLRLLGLFDRPADAACLTALRNPPPIAGLTEPLIGLNEEDWNLTLSSLADCSLLAVQSSIVNRQSSIDAHPLIREYFANQLREKNPDAWRAAHRRLYEHLTESTEDKPDATLEDLQPLYQAVAHGCQAGMQQEACDHVYNARIGRRDEFYSTRKLGAFGADLGAVACFFDEAWGGISPALSEGAQAWLLNQAGFRLRALGRLTEALEPMRAGLPIELNHQDWRNAAARACNLSELNLTLGRVTDAVPDPDQSVTFADRSSDQFMRVAVRTALADALHQAGRRADALASFREAEAIQAEREPEHPLLYSAAGFQYCDLLLAEPERAAWQTGIGLEPVPDCAQDARDGLIARCREVDGRGQKMFEWRMPCDSLLTIALDHLTLARAALYRAILGHSAFRIPHSDLAPARQHVTDAVDGLRRAGTMDHLPRALLSRAWLRVLEGDPDGSGRDLDDGWQIAERGPMRLHMTDILLHRARLFHAVRPYPWPGPQKDPGPTHDLADARKLIHHCGYHRRDEELADAQQAAKSWPP
ncbi:MAG TPA: TIR domain-containing protein [Phycisphaerae bacterium]|nr:TIR domain-containing protein [Phycisphaerae bacterium]HUU84236.1 TIR domain-containing protein [Phycisphaerae bacterium]